MGKTALIWGTGGIGLAILRHLTKNGWQVIGLSRSKDILDGETPHAYEVDLKSPSSVKEAAFAISQEFEEVDLWVYAAGDILSKPVSKLEVAEWQTIMDANLNGLFLSTHYSLPLLSREGAVYIIGAQIDRLILPGLSAYVASKAAVEGFAGVLRKEIRKPVVIVQPQAVYTPLWNKVPFKIPPGAIQPEDLADRIYKDYLEGSRENHLLV